LAFDPRTPRRWREVIVIFLTTRAALFLVAWLATYLLPSGMNAQPGNLRYSPEAPRTLQAWAHWDAQWYLLIADRGYAALEETPSLAPRNPPEDTSGFFPLYPMVVRLLSALTGLLGGSIAAGLLVSNLALLGFLVLLRTWTGDRFGDEAGRGACLALCLFPTSLFLSAPYSESLFLLLAMGSVMASDKSRNLPAGLLALAAALTRPVGALLVLPLAWSALRRDLPGRQRFSRLAAAACAPAGLLLFAGFCRMQFGDPWAFLARQERWRGALGPPWTFLMEFLREPRAHGGSGSTVDLVVALLALATLPFVFRKLGTGPGLYSAAVVLLPLSSGLFSFSRLVLAAFPLFVMTGTWWAERPDVRITYPAIALPFAGLFTALYATGWWVG
jgi:hypothetical protein